MKRVIAGLTICALAINFWASRAEAQVTSEEAACSQIKQSWKQVKGKGPIERAQEQIPTDTALIYTDNKGKSYAVISFSVKHGFRTVWLTFVDGDSLYAQAGEFWWPNSLFRVEGNNYPVAYLAFDGKHVVHTLPAGLISELRAPGSVLEYRHFNKFWRLEKESPLIRGFLNALAGVGDVSRCLNKTA